MPISRQNLAKLNFSSFFCALFYVINFKRNVARAQFDPIKRMKVAAYVMYAKSMLTCDTVARARISFSFAVGARVVLKLGAQFKHCVSFLLVLV